MIRWGQTLSKLFGLQPTARAGEVAGRTGTPTPPSTPGVVPPEGLGLAPHVARKPGARAQALVAADVDGFHTLKVVAQPTSVTPTRVASVAG